MKILYVANHRINHERNDNIGGVAHGLRTLGHQVYCVEEKNYTQEKAKKFNTDFTLCHHPQLKLFDALPDPVFFWYFDRVEGAKFIKRKKTINHYLKKARLGFCTDGDAVRADETGRLVTLRQGADTRVVGTHSKKLEDIAPIVFVGTKANRPDFIQFMQDNFKDKFQHIGNKQRIYKERLSNVLTSAKIVVAPDKPTSDHYWSNRIYAQYSLGAKLIHPFCADLAGEYVPTLELLMYRSRQALLKQIEWALAKPYEFNQVCIRGLHKTVMEYNYTQRCRKLISHIEKVL